jgi:hypothetical protein
VSRGGLQRLMLQMGYERYLYGKLRQNLPKVGPSALGSGVPSVFTRPPGPLLCLGVADCQRLRMYIDTAAPSSIVFCSIEPSSLHCDAISRGFACPTRHASLATATISIGRLRSVAVAATKRISARACTHIASQFCPWWDIGPLVELTCLIQHKRSAVVPVLESSCLSCPQRS